MVGIRLAIDRDQIGPNVAVATVLPRPGQRVIVMTLRQGPIGCRIGYNVLDHQVEGLDETASLLASLARISNQGHGLRGAIQPTE